MWDAHLTTGHDMLDKLFHRTPEPAIQQATIDGYRQRLAQFGPELDGHVVAAADAFRRHDMLDAEGAASRANSVVRNITHMDGASPFASDRQVRKYYAAQERYLARIPGDVGEALRAMETIPEAGATAFRYGAFDDTITSARATSMAAKLDDLSAIIKRFV